MDYKSSVYKSGEKPQVGDMVKVVDRDTRGGYNSSIELNATKNYEVLGVSQGSKSTLVSINSGGYSGKQSYTSNRFNLVSSMSGTKRKGPPAYVVFANAKVMAAVADEGALKTRLSELLLAAPTSEFHVFSYVSTAKTKKPIVEYFDLSHDAQAPQPPTQRIGVIEKDNMFKNK